ncbi:hypothetical protein CEP54_013213 [Fusarium duplospermum]|uniref:Heterokaryon incompatibility domain-containing protein n=1 Tax=Fusarium duplospermum TaxID=1325734 RepID=A0A428P441_9HYPO|nr:hypothetical protein CEP54_013213 [Fusarium duplospermum]
MADDFISAHGQVMSDTPEKPLSAIEPKGQATDVLSPDASFSPVAERFQSPDDIHVPVEQSQECEADTSDANVSDSDWETIDEDISEETSDDESTYDKATKDHGASKEATEDENTSNSKHSEPTWDNPDDLLSYVWSHVDPDSVLSVQIIRQMGKICRKVGKFGKAESLLRMAQHKLDRIAGRLHEDTLETVFSLASVLSYLGNLDEAGKLARRAIRGFLKVKGPGDATTLRVLRDVSCAYSAICRQLLKHDPPADSEERHQLSRHTDMYISICQDLPLSAVSDMLGSLGSVLVLAGHAVNANLAFQWKYISLASESHDWHVCKMCEQEISSLPLRVCLTCTDVELCSSCYRSFASSNIQESSEDSRALGSLSSCIAHEFFEVEKNGSQQLPVGDDLETTDQFNDWLRDVAKEVQGTNAGLLSPDAFLIGAEETPDDTVLTYLMQHFTTETTRALMGIQPSAENELSRVDNTGPISRFNTWILDTLNNIPSWDPFILANASAKTISAPLVRHAVANTVQDEDVWNIMEEQLWKYNPNYPPNQQEVPSIEVFTAALIVEAQSPKNTIPNEANPLATSCIISSHSVYDRLPLNQGGMLIRLLELLPADTAEPVMCNLVVANMLDNPLYEAVSYTWGAGASPTHEVAVQVNNVRFQVTPNLHACLLALRHRGASRTLWVDAICINQKDDDEKSEQVARMASIYSSASNVLVYLGDGGEADEALFRYLNRERKQGESFEASLNRLGLSKPEILKSFAALCRREWWTRIWIQQEFALSPTDPTFCLGHLRAQASPLFLDVFKALVEEVMMMECLSADGRWSFGLKLSQHINPVVNTLGMRRRFKDGSKNLNTVLAMTPQSKCSDPRDFIFGRYIFMKPMLRAVFKPDYSLTTESLFEMVAIWLLKIEIGMELFWFYPRRLSSKLPSWVPDFTKRVSDMESPFPPEEKREWRAEGQTDDPLDIDCGVLKVHARPLDTISHVFRVGDAALHELAGQIMFLEQSLLVITEQDPPHRRHFLSEVLPSLKAELRPKEWALGSDLSIYESLPRDQAFLASVEAAKFVESQFEDSHDRFLSILSHQEDNTPLADYDSRIRELFREFTKTSLEFVKRFRDFHLLLLREHLTELFWASLCDSKNLIGQIKDLKTPRQPSSPPSCERRNVMDLVNQMIKEIHMPDVPFPVSAENEDIERLCPSSSPSYEDLQATIANCEFEEEVQLRASTLTEELALPTLDDSAGSFTDFLQWGDLFNWDIIPNSIALDDPFLANNIDSNRWEGQPSNLAIPGCADTSPDASSRTIDRPVRERYSLILPVDILPDAPRLLTQFKNVLVHRMSSLPIYEKSPWSTMHIPAAMITLSKLTLFSVDASEISHANMSNFYGLLAVSAYHLSLKDQESGDLSRAEGYWAAVYEAAYDGAKRHLDLSLDKETQGLNRAKYKEQLMAMGSTTTTSFISNNQVDVDHYLVEFEKLFRTRGLAKGTVSRRTQLLHHLYAWIRIVSESTRMRGGFSMRYRTQETSAHRQGQSIGEVDDDGDPVTQDGRRAIVVDPKLDDFFRLPPRTPARNKDTHQETHFSGTGNDEDGLYMQIYGIPETWLRLLSQTTRLANEMDMLHQPDNQADIEIFMVLQRRASQLEESVCAFRSKCRAFGTSNSTSHLHMLRALCSALLIYFYQRIRRVNPMILQSIIDDVIKALKDYDGALKQQGLEISGTAWPALIAGSEAESKAQRDQIIAWIETRILATGFGSYYTAKEIIEDVWERRDGTSNLATWMDVCRDKGRWPILA